MQIGDIVYLDPDNLDWYAKNVAEWCNANGAMSVEIDPIDREVDEKYVGTGPDGHAEDMVRHVTKSFRRFEIRAVPEPTQEEKENNARATRDAYLQQFVDPVVSNPLRWGELSDDEKQQYADYRGYLLDYPQSDEFPDAAPKTFEQWKNQ